MSEVLVTHAELRFADGTRVAIEFANKESIDGALAKLRLASTDTPAVATDEGVVELSEAFLVVKNEPLNVSLPADWATCSHEWKIYGDGGDLGGNRFEVICRKCKCPGDFDEDHLSVAWPTT